MMHHAIAKPMREDDLFRARLTSIIDMNHALVKLAKEIQWEKFEETFSPHFCEGKGRTSLPVRLMVGLMYLKHVYNLSDEGVLEKRLENPYWQYFTGEEFFCHELPLDASSMTRWRKRITERGAESLLEATIDAGLRMKEISPKALTSVIADTTVQPKAIRFPTDARLYDRMRETLVREAQKLGIELRQTYARVGKKWLRKQGGYAKAKQAKRSKAATKKLKTFLGRVLRDIQRKIPERFPVDIPPSLLESLSKAERLLQQTRKSSNKLYSIHEPDVACVAKGKAHKPYEFGSKVSIVTTLRGNWILGVHSFSGNPYDGHTLQTALQQAERLTQTPITTAVCDLGYRKHGIPKETCDVQIADRFRRPGNRTLRCHWKRRNAIEPIIGHLKSEHRLDRNRLKGVYGDTINALLSAAAFNFKKLLRAFCALLRTFLQNLSPTFLSAPSFMCPQCCV